MRSLSASDLLNILEAGSDRTPVEQALIVLHAALPNTTTDALAKLTIGQRDALLFRLRELTFGPLLQGVVDCPKCHERLELVFDARTLQLSNAAFPDPAAMASQPVERTIAEEDYQITFRLPNSTDLAVSAPSVSIEQARQTIAELCIVSIQQQNKTISVKDLPTEVLVTVIKQMENTDPYGNLNLSAICPACNHSWSILFDIVSYFWKEISSWAARLMNEVHLLAWAYGWQEKEILVMSAWRRQRYLELIGS
jgi:hypothetical protein